MDISSVSNPGHILPAVSETQSPQWLTQNRELIRAVKSIDPSSLFGEDSELTFAMDRQSKRMVVRIINRQTQQVIMQLPPEYMLELARDLKAHGQMY